MSGESSEVVPAPREQYAVVVMGLLVGLVLIAMAVDTLRRLKAESAVTPTGEVDE